MTNQTPMINVKNLDLGLCHLFVIGYWSFDIFI